MFLRFICSAVFISSSFFLMHKYDSIVWIYHNFLSSCLLMDIWVGSIFWIKWVMPLEIVLYKVLCGHVLISLGYILSRIFWLNYNGVFNLLRNGQNVFLNGYTTFFFHQQRTRVQISLPPCQHLFLCEYLILLFRWVWSSVSLWLLFIFPKDSWCWQSFHVLLAIFISSLEKSLFCLCFPPRWCVSFITLVLNCLFTYYL